MKIIRFLNQNNQVRWGGYDEEDSQNPHIIEGDILGDYSVTPNREKIQKVLPPVDPPNIMAIGLNYRKHADETGVSYPDIPVLFLKATSTLIGNGDDIQLPKAGPKEVDYEGELAVVIRKGGKNIPRDQAVDHVLGYTCAIDVSARDWQKHKQKKQWARGKSFDTFCPVGPVLVTADEIPHPNQLNIQTRLNDQIVQDSNTGDMFFHIPDIISNLSQSITLLPGTVILTGTPEGVGFTRTPPLFLKSGDQVTVTIEKIGILSCPVVAEA